MKALLTHSLISKRGQIVLSTDATIAQCRHSALVTRATVFAPVNYPVLQISPEHRAEDCPVLFL